jgi:citrate synthase
MATMTAREAARRMGVKVETLYAYVSRGLLESHPAADGRASLFDARAIEALARRGRPRQSSRNSSLNLLIETQLTSLSPQGVRYRGFLSSDLARTRTFENVADLLWLGQLSDVHETWHGTTFTGFDGMALGDALRLIASMAMAASPNESGLEPVEVAKAGRHLVATIVDSLPLAGDGRTPRLSLPDGSHPIRSTIAGRLWTRLSPRRPPPGMLAALNGALVLLADHELAASTLGVRVAASTRANPYAVVTAGLGVLSGPFHGGASRVARDMLDRAAEIGPTRAITEILRSGRRVPGFGHSVYIDIDPRAKVLLDLLRRLGGSPRMMAIVDEVHAEVVERVGREPNVDFALAAMTVMSGMPADGGEVVMAIARTAGWLAHAIEEYGEVPLRFRPRASYIGR